MIEAGTPRAMARVRAAAVGFLQASELLLFVSRVSNKHLGANNDDMTALPVSVAEHPVPGCSSREYLGSSSSAVTAPT